MVISVDILYLLFGFFIIFVLPFTDATVRLSLSIPVPSVKVNGILSLYCRINDLGNKQLVTISRTIDGSEDRERLTWGNYVNHGVDERTFLAVRHQSDGSVVHFLTIVNVNQEEEGDYHCSIRDSNSLSEIDSANVKVKIQHVPDTMYPICFPDVPLIVNEGDKMSFNCTSEAALPEVDMTWSHTKDIPLSGQSTTLKDGQLRTLKYETKVTMDDDSAMFVCTVTSKAFPDYSKTCHIGPLKVTRNPLADFETNMPDKLIPLPTKEPVQTNNDIGQVRHSTECSEYCSSLSSPTFYWIVATVVAGSFAFLFIFITAILVVKYYRSTPKKRHHREMQIYGVGAEDIYTELDAVPEGVKQVYMSLQNKPVQVGRADTPCKLGKVEGDVYTVTAAFNPDSNF